MFDRWIGQIRYDLEWIGPDDVGTGGIPDDNLDGAGLAVGGSFPVDPEAVDGEQRCTSESTRLPTRSTARRWLSRFHGCGPREAAEAGLGDVSRLCRRRSGHRVTCKLVSGADTLMLTVVVTAVNGSSLEYEVGKSGE